jgi:pentatricopeptide repeat protein
MLKKSTPHSLHVVQNLGRICPPLHLILVGFLYPLNTQTNTNTITMGIWDILKKKLANDNEEHHGEYAETAAKNVYDIASFDMNTASLSDKMLYLLENRSQGEQIQFADKLLREGPFEVSIKMYEALSQKYPEERDRYENGIGSAYVKLGQHEKAVQYFTLARSHGMHPDISDKHIWDACQKHFKTSGETGLLSQYAKFSPEGKHHAEASRLLLEAGISPEKESRASYPDTAPVAQNTPIETPQTEDDVAKKAKLTPENQFSLFGDEPTRETPKEEPETVTPEAKVAPLEQVSEEEILDDEEEEEGSGSEMDLEFSVRPNMPSALDNHIDQFFDFDDVVVWKDKRDDDLRVDIYHIKPSEDRDFHILITSGMSRLPMNVPGNANDFKYGELLAILPEDWDLSQEGLKNSNNYWPVLWLKNLARIPQQYNSWLCYGHSIPNGDPSKPIADTEFQGVVIMDSTTLPEDFLEVKVGEDTLYLYTIIPVYAEEMQYKIEHGVKALSQKMEEANIPDWIIPFRPSAL